MLTKKWLVIGSEQAIMIFGDMTVLPTDFYHGTAGLIRNDQIAPPISIFCQFLLNNGNGLIDAIRVFLKPIRSGGHNSDR